MPTPPFQLPGTMADQLHRLGLAEEAGPLVPPPGGSSGSGNHEVLLTRLAWNDWQFLAAARLPGAAMQLHEMLGEGLERLRAARWVALDFTPVGSTGQVFSQRRLCWVLRLDRPAGRIIVHAIVQAGLDPFRCVWRYFDQGKATDLLRTNELYLRRLDLLVDQFEARPTGPMVAARTDALTRVFGTPPAAFLRSYDQERRALYVCCWHKAERETPRMWAEYCGDRGGFAVQSTERQLQHQFVRMLEGRQALFFRDVTYVDHESHDPPLHGVPEQAFLKRREFTHEQEIRFAWFAIEAISGTESEIEAKLAALPEGRRLPFDLAAAVEHIVLNPGASPSQQSEIRQILAQRHPGLLPRVVASSFTP